MLWCNFVHLFGMLAVVLRSYRPLAVFPFIYIWTGKNFTWARILSITPCTKKWPSTQTAEDYQQKIKIHQCFPCQNFVPYGI